VPIQYFGIDRRPGRSFGLTPTLWISAKLLVSVHFLSQLLGELAAAETFAK
jgi:hypothetical protein